MQHIVDYLARGGPVVGLRTATHAFQISRPDAKFLKFTWNGTGEFAGGFGRQILGRDLGVASRPNHRQSSRLELQAGRGKSSHPARREGCLGAVGRLHGQSDRGQSGSCDGEGAERHDARTRRRRPTNRTCPSAWYRTYEGASGRTGRVFTTTHGASEDLLNDGFRRMLVNALLWAAGSESVIPADRSHRPCRALRSRPPTISTAS